MAGCWRIRCRCVALQEAIVSEYPRLHRDWPIAGAVLHDIGKVEDLGTSRCLGYTARGQLIGHVALGLEILERHVSRLPAFPVEVKRMLQHLIVSHHGEIEKGALRAPMFPEALALSMIDLLDARLEQAWRLIDQGPPCDEWTAYAPSLERQLYRWSALLEGPADVEAPPNGTATSRRDSSAESLRT
jgi:3'-5' exoribonuclease